jgi:hypothetical protein
VITTFTTGPGFASGQYAVTALMTAQNGSAGSMDISCWLRDVSVRSGSTFNPTPAGVLTGTVGHRPYTVAATGMLSASRSTDIQVICQLHAHGSGVKVTAEDITLARVSTRTAVAYRTIRNRFFRV